jgi:hypothetical protein
MPREEYERLAARLKLSRSELFRQMIEAYKVRLDEEDFFRLSATHEPAGREARPLHRSNGGADRLRRPAFAPQWTTGRARSMMASQATPAGSVPNAAPWSPARRDAQNASATAGWP